MARKKNPKYKKQDLINKIVDFSCNGILQAAIIEWLKTEGECKIDYCYLLLKEAKPLINDVLKDLSKDRLEKTITDLERMLYETPDRKLRLEIQKEINKISGLHNQTQKVDVTSKGNAITEIKLIQVTRENKDGK